MTSRTGAGESEGGADDDLGRSLEGLAGLAAGTLPLEQLLTRVARYAVQAIPGADGAGLTLLEHDRPDLIVATEDFVRAVDAVQYGRGRGPCIDAAREGRTVISGSLDADPRWGDFGRDVAAMGVHSVVSLPLQHEDDVLGAMNVYARAHDAFDEHAAAVGEAFAAPAAVAVQNAAVLEQTRRVASRLQATLAGRLVVEQAVGVLMTSEVLDDTQARARLDALAAQRHEDLEAVAHEVVRRATGGNRGSGPADDPGDAAPDA